MAKKYVVVLTDDERKQLVALLKKDKVAARKVQRAQLLLQADEGASDVTIAATLHVGVATVERTRKRVMLQICTSPKRYAMVTLSRERGGDGPHSCPMSLLSKRAGDQRR